MLKIKDNVDLKELEKFGFERETKDYYTKHWFINYDGQPTIEIYMVVVGNALFNNYKILNQHKFKQDLHECYWEQDLYDLIKADLVEKIGDE